MVICGTPEGRAFVENPENAKQIEEMVKEAYESWKATEPSEPREETTSSGKQVFTKEQLEILNLAFAKAGCPGAISMALASWVAGERA